MKNLFKLIVCLLLLSSCSKDGAADSAFSPPTGKGGSLARFTIIGNYLYVADHYEIDVFDISDPANSSLVGSVSTSVPGTIETIFPFQGKLFVGSTDGMIVFSLDNPAQPTSLGSVSHLRSCDPVVVNDSIAFITLRSGTRCGPAEDGLYIHRLNNYNDMPLITMLPMSTPFGLGLQDSVLYVTRGTAGMNIYNISAPANPVFIKSLTGRSFFDVIPYGNLLISQLDTGIELYDITNLSLIHI